MRESELERKFCRLVAQAGGRAYKFVSPGNAGVPDRLVELKREGGRPRKLQRLRMEELEALGCFTAVVDGPESARDAIGELLKQEPAAPAADRLFLEMVNRRPGKGGTAF